MNSTVSLEMQHGWFLSLRVMVTLFPEKKVKEHGLTQEFVFLPDVKSIWKREIGSQHVRMFHDIYVDYIRGQKKRTYRIITLPHMLANVIGDFVSNA